MVTKITGLVSPPDIGSIYLVPCVYGVAAFAKDELHWWPVLTPSHEDSYYWPRYRESEAVFGFPHHFHIDARFSPREWYIPEKQTDYNTQNYLTTIAAGRSSERNYGDRFIGDLEWREMECLREMPKSYLFAPFGEKFVLDHRDKELKCGRCPHKGIDLRSMPVRNGAITCPAHGLRFSAHTGRCITKLGDLKRAR